MFFLIPDINECADKKRCGKNAKCINYAGSYECKCNPGYIGKGKVCFGNTMNICRNEYVVGDDKSGILIYVAIRVTYTCAYILALRDTHV